MTVDGQGLHVDPADGADAPDPAGFFPAWRAVWNGPLMELFRSCLPAPGGDDVRSGVLDDLSTYYGYSPEECVQRCLHWEELSVAEWKAADRSSPEGLADFYHTTQSWSFDVLWWAYLQATGYASPASVLVADELARRGVAPHGEHLDFGAGVGVTAQFFRRLGYATTLADISTTLQEFAKYRLERRGEHASFLDLNEAALPEGRYDVVTALDVLAHVPDVAATARDLHRAMKPGALLFANYDTRPRADANAWHLYADARPLQWAVLRAGFARRGAVAGTWHVYERVDAHGLVAALRLGRDVVWYRFGLADLAVRLRHRAGRLARKAFRLR